MSVDVGARVGLAAVGLQVQLKTGTEPCEGEGKEGRVSACPTGDDCSFGQD